MELHINKLWGNVTFLQKLHLETLEMLLRTKLRSLCKGMAAPPQALSVLPGSGGEMSAFSFPAASTPQFSGSKKMMWSY